MIELQHVSKTYGQVVGVVDFSATIESGIVGLVGRNGAGKSTVLGLIAGLLRPSTGLVTVDGCSPTRPAARRAIALCPDIDAFPEDLSGLAFVRWMLRLSGFSGREARTASGEALERVGLAEAMDRRLRGYSKGMRQRTKLALALARRPRALLLDEPMTGLDPVARRDMAARLVELGREGVTVLVSSHVLHELEELADRVLLVHRGRLVAVGAVHELRDQLGDRPYRLLLRSADPRRLAIELAGLEMVRGIRFNDEGIEIETDRAGGLFEQLTAMGAEGKIDEIRPLDEDLESVFGYLAGPGVRGGRVGRA